MRSGPDSLRRKWRRIGYRFACTAHPDPVDPEMVLAESVVCGRNDPDLFWAALSWLIAYGDLVNLSRLFRLTGIDTGAVMGALAESALAHGADRRLRRITERNTPRRSPEILFSVMAQSPTLARHETESPDPIMRKWGYFCSNVSVKPDALNNRQFVLSHNGNLALRALFGPHARADILWALLQVSQQTITDVARFVGLSYQPVYSEIESMVRNGFLTCRTWGRTKVVELTPATAALLQAIPPAEFSCTPGTHAGTEMIN